MNFYATEDSFKELLKIVDETSESYESSSFEGKTIAKAEMISTIVLVYLVLESILSMCAMAIYPLFNNSQKYIADL